MKNLIAFFCILWLSLCFGCSVVGGIFKAGVWVGILAAAAVVGVIIYFISRGASKN
jgi:hypothetical protein